MQKILFPTDFSINSVNAIRYGLKLLNRSPFHAILLNAYNIPPIPPGEQSLFPENYLTDLIKESEKGLMRVKEILLEEEEISPGSIECHTQIGPLLSAVQETTEIVKPDLIIMGTHGATSIEKKLIGTNTYSVMKNTSTPVLAIPENVKFKPLRSLVFSTDYKPVQQVEHLQPVAWIAKQFGAVIKILHVTQKDKIADVKVAAEGLKLHHFLDGLSHHFFFIENDSVEEGITNFIESQACDLLVMVIHDRPFFERVFHASIARKVVMQGKIPILTLHA